MPGNLLDRIPANRYYRAQVSTGIPMTTDKTIFGLRFRSNERLQPSLEELRSFLESPKKEDKGKLHGDDLAAYRDLLNAVEAFEHSHQATSGTECSTASWATPILSSQPQAGGGAV